MALLWEFCIVLTKVVIIAGPTASGKSAYAFKMAQEAKGLIINADSLQIYRGFDILTAQPSPGEQAALPHRLYGFLAPSTPYSVGKWLPLARAEIDTAHQQGLLPLIVGGTGFYLKMLMEGLPSLPPMNPAVRKELQLHDTSALYQDLIAVDPALAARLIPEDRQRIMRGLEVFHSTGKPLSFWQSHPPVPPPYSFEVHLCSPSPKELAARIEKRLGEMFQRGVLDEISTLMTQPLSSTSQKAIGLNEFASYSRGESSLEDAKNLVLIRTRQYAKRQRTWFRHQLKADHVIGSL